MNPNQPKGVLLESLTWPEAEAALTYDTVVVIPLGAAAKEHGPHLTLANDFLTAEYLKQCVLDRVDVVVAPTLNTGFYPAFLAYPGSVSLRLATARDLLIDVCATLARYGPRRFYVINTGISTLRALGPAAVQLAELGVLLHYTDLADVNRDLRHTLLTQQRGSHADEAETSVMLQIAPHSVDMRKAVCDYGVENGPGPLTRDPSAPGTYSPTGIYGDATLATVDKGRLLAEGLVAAVVADIERLRKTVPPNDDYSPQRLETFIAQLVRGD